METFAPTYFDYMSSSFTAGVCLLLITLSSVLITLALCQRPTLLAKIFGCFKVTWKTTSHFGPGKPKINQLNLLVMENLLYNRRFSKVSQSSFGLHFGNIWLKHDRICFLGKIYDLKGSTRGRHVQSTGRENEVLLDENLNESEYLSLNTPNVLLRIALFRTAAHLSPFFLREHSKRILRGALHSDSKFLADINVMDYSFVVGVDSGRNELVVGIVGEWLHGRSVVWMDSDSMV